MSNSGERLQHTGEPTTDPSPDLPTREEAYITSLGRQALAVIGPVLDQEVIASEARQELEAVIMGRDGSVPVSVAVVRTLYAAKLLWKGSTTMNQLKASGWSDIVHREDPLIGVDYRCRITEYLVQPPEDQGFSNVPNELRLTAGRRDPRANPKALFDFFDFTHWNLNRSTFVPAAKD